MSVDIVETTWLHRIAEIDSRETNEGPILLITLSSGHQYAIPLTNPEVRRHVSRIASPITVAGSMPINGSGASSASQ